MALIISALLWLLLLFTRTTASRIALELPATAMHELSHWLVAFLTGSRPGFPSLWPKREGNHWVLGTVTFSPGTWTAGGVALAPALILMPVAYWGLFVRPKELLVSEIIAGLGYGYAAWGCVPSSTDFEIALKYPLGTTIIVGFVFGSLWLY